MKKTVTTQTFPLPNLKLQKVHLFKWHSFCNGQQNRVRVRVFNATFNNISNISWRSVLFVEETGVLHPEKITDLCKSLRNYHIILYWVYTSLNGIGTHNFCTDSYKSNYRMITTTAALRYIGLKHSTFMKVIHLIILTIFFWQFFREKSFICEIRNKT